MELLGERRVALVRGGRVREESLGERLDVAARFFQLPPLLRDFRLELRDLRLELLDLVPGLGGFAFGVVEGGLQAQCATVHIPEASRERHSIRLGGFTRLLRLLLRLAKRRKRLHSRLFRLRFRLLDPREPRLARLELSLEVPRRRKR